MGQNLSCLGEKSRKTSVINGSKYVKGQKVGKYVKGQTVAPVSIQYGLSYIATGSCYKQVLS